MLELEPAGRAVSRQYLRSRRDDLIILCCPPAVMQHSQRHPCWRGWEGSAEDRQISLSHSPGARSRDKPELRYDFAGRKREGRGALDKTVAAALFYPFTLLTVTRACAMNATEVELLQTQRQARSNLVTILFTNNTGLLLWGPQFRSM